MKTTILKISFIFLFLSLMGAGCEKDKPEALGPGLTIYKTSNDYFNNASINLMDGKVYYLPDIPIETDGNGIVHHKFRVKLANGYILASGDHSIYTAFLSYTVEEYYNMMEVQKIHPSFNELQNNIIDSDPFEKYYYDTIPYGSGGFEFKDTAKINEIIRNGEIEKYFKKLK